MGLLDLFGADTGDMGMLGKLAETLRDNSGMLMGFGSDGFEGAARGSTLDGYTRKLKQEQLQQAAEARATEAMAKQLGVDPALVGNKQAVQSLWLSRNTPKERSLEDQWLMGLDPESRNKVMQRKFLGGGGNEYGLTPLIGEDGTVIQLGKDGSVNRPNLPEGFRVSRKPIEMDLGTHIVLIDPITRQQIGTRRKDIAGVAAQKEIGEAEGKAAVGAPNQIQAAQNTLDLLDKIEMHPSRESATGFQSIFPTRAGSKVADFEGMVEQAKSGAFLTAVQNLKGLGAMSEYEARSATAAINRMNVATSDEGFLEALRDYRTIVQQAKAKAEQILAARGGSTGAGTTPPAPANARDDLKTKYGLE
jgi:hypothetical protein